MKKTLIAFSTVFINLFTFTEWGLAATFAIYTNFSEWQATVGNEVLDDFSDDTAGRFYSQDFGNFTGTSSNSTELYQPSLYNIPSSDPQTYISFRLGTITFQYDYNLSAFGFYWKNTSDPYSDLVLDVEGNTWLFHNPPRDTGYSFFGVVATEGTFDTITIQINGTRYANVTDFRYSVPAGDIYFDTAVDLKDVITGLQVLANQPVENVIDGGDVDSDKRVGLQEILYDLKQISGQGN